MEYRQIRLGSRFIFGTTTGGTMQGKMKIESELAKGTKVTFTLPVLNAAD